MINKLENFFKNELAYKKLVIKKLGFWQRIYHNLIFLYFGVFLFSILLLNFFPILAIILLLIIVVDANLLIRDKKKGVLYNYFTKRDAMIDRAFEDGNNVKIGDDGLSLKILKLRAKKTKKFLKENSIDFKPDFIINSLRHREAVNASFLVFVVGILVVAISVSLLEFVKIYLKVDFFTDILDKVRKVKEGDQSEINQMKYLLMFLIAIVLIIQTFFYSIPAFFAKRYLEIRFKNTKQLQDLLEYMVLVKKKKK
ncbi:hypothetical protein ATE84_1238 [Aquimarina sp. MAR_2010_214]|uniref:hypothetical protein n=1 Tax=Aquimarina sp. MAR_2010_214 TaxID=1250026 RepID=UPI000C712D32|nr:hypothetical protein [Aquimarina sp. MAR_2010_214]PKV49218.1 hypothetical protein ATE84_1238 [Aquimarina sp. MAR_2010_214]